MVLAEYELLQHDFPELRDDALACRFPRLGDADPKRRRAEIRRIIDDWLVRNAAMISESQTTQTEVNTPIDTVGEAVTVYRPPRYGRSVVVSIRNNNATLDAANRERWRDEANGLLDIKGAGVSPRGNPSTRRHHSDGLLPVRDALGDLAMQWVIDTIFRFTGTDYWTVRPTLYSIWGSTG